ncbi:hypothetical protein LOK49_LG02G01403 [Camellia lanceoleosa]|uniref:Uncharacterized protein n=1 Tax=Camellia lanceoleosa TaxID=1840588 RepID=A0ACC0II01_9ERIC|nr:hypothetical protein LOK49_LG02G01403 [Camellia lanceoleosa]
MTAAEEPILPRLDRLDKILKHLEEARSSSNNRSPRSSYTSSTGTLTSDRHGSSIDEFSPESLEKHCRPIDDVIVETELKGTLLERLVHVELRVLKLCLLIEGEIIEGEKKTEEMASITEQKVKKKKNKGGLKQFVKSCVKGKSSSGKEHSKSKSHQIDLHVSVCVCLLGAKGGWIPVIHRRPRKNVETQVNAASHLDSPLDEGSSHCNGVATSCNDNSKCYRKSGIGKEEEDEVEVELAVELNSKAELALVERGSIMKEMERQVNGIDDMTASRVIETGSGLGIGDIDGACMVMERRLSDFQIQGEDEGSCQVVGNVDNMGYLKSLSGLELQRPSINLEVVIGLAQDNGLCNGVGGVCINHAASNGLALVEEAIVSKDIRAGQLSLPSE